MSRISRRVLIGALTVVFLSSACGRLSLTAPTPVWTVTPAGGLVLTTATVFIPATGTDSYGTPVIPITGEDAVTLQCEFCVESESHAVLIFSEFDSFDVSSDTPVSCLTADVTDGRRILVCHGTQSTTFYLNICSDPSNCLRFSVALQPCTLLQPGATPVTTGTPFNLTPIGTLKANQKLTKEAVDTAEPSSTPAQGGVPATSTSPVIPPTGTSGPATPTPASYAGNMLADPEE